MSEAKTRQTLRLFRSLFIPLTPLCCFADSAIPKCQCKQEDVIQSGCPVCRATSVVCRAQHNHGIVQDRGVKTGEPQDEQVLAAPPGELGVPRGHGLVGPTVSLYLQKKT